MVELTMKPVGSKDYGTKYGIFNANKGHWLWDSRGDIFVFTDPVIAEAQAEVLKVLARNIDTDRLASSIWDTDDELIIKVFATGSLGSEDG